MLKFQFDTTEETKTAQVTQKKDRKHKNLTSHSSEPFHSDKGKEKAG